VFCSFFGYLSSWTDIRLTIIQLHANFLYIDVYFLIQYTEASHCNFGGTRTLFKSSKWYASIKSLGITALVLMQYHLHRVQSQILKLWEDH